MSISIASNIISFMKIVETLCVVKRDNKLSNGESESDSDHGFKLCFLAMMVMPYLKEKADYTKILEMALVHDIVEARSGDISMSAQQNNPDLKAQKKAAEKEAIAYYKSVLPAPLNAKIYDLFMEYEARETREAKLVYALDKLEAHLQANWHKDGDVHYWGDCPNGHLYYEIAARKTPAPEEKALRFLNEEILDDLETLIYKLAQENMAKCGITL